MAHVWAVVRASDDDPGRHRLDALRAYRAAGLADPDRDTESSVGLVTPILAPRAAAIGLMVASTGPSPALSYQSSVQNFRIIRCRQQTRPRCRSRAGGPSPCLCRWVPFEKGIAEIRQTRPSVGCESRSSGASVVVRLTAVADRFSSGSRAGAVVFFDFLLAMFTFQVISASALVTSNTV